MPSSNLREEGPGPRERYALEGPGRAGEVELLALVLGTGAAGRTTRGIAAELIDRFGGVDGIAQTPPAALTRIQGVGLARAVRVHAACSLAGRRQRPSLRAISGAQDAAELLVPGLRALRHEELHVLLLGHRGRLLAHRRVSQGSDRVTVMEPRMILRPALEVGALGLVVAHNHPSGDPRPSPADQESTDRLQQAARVLGLALWDHIVVGGEQWVSMAALGMVQGPMPSLAHPLLADGISTSESHALKPCGRPRARPLSVSPSLPSARGAPPSPAAGPPTGARRG